jgi:hypothetical protein
MKRQAALQMLCALVVSGILPLALFASEEDPSGDDKKPADEKQTDAKPEKKNLRIPEFSEKWTIRLEGYAGTPSDRTRIRLTLGHDGSLRFENARRKDPFRKVFDGELDEGDTKQVYDGVVKIINEYRLLKSRGKIEDGWDFTLRISTSAKSASVRFDDQGEIEDAAPGFEDITEIINARIKETGASFPE